MKRLVRRPLPEAAYLSECFVYYPDTGEIVWKYRPEHHFATVRSSRTWNTRYANKPAGMINASGHLLLRVDDTPFLAHRVIWKMVTGQEPPEIIDHKDRNPGNNRWKNFREATKGQNNINSSLQRGIHFDKSRGNWQAYTKLNGKKVYLGRHPSKRQALIARQEGVRRLFGEFAP